MPPPILICFDESAGAAAALRAAATLLTAHEALVLSVAVRAEDEAHFSPVGDVVGRLTRLYKEWDGFMRDLAKRQAEAGVVMAEEAGLRARPLTAVGNAADEIVRVGDEHEVAATVLGARRHSVVGGILGSVSAHVVAQSARPVLVIPAR